MATTKQEEVFCASEFDHTHAAISSTELSNKIQKR